VARRLQVLLAVPVPPALVERVAAIADVGTCVPPFPPRREDVLAKLPTADVLLTSNLLPIDGGMLDAGVRLRAICNVGVGYDNVNVDDLTRRGIVVTNTPGVLTDAVADFTIGLVLALARRIPEAASRVRSGEWVTGAVFPLGMELGGKTLSIIGL